MAAVRSLAVGALVCGMLTTAAHADPITWHWTAWTPATGIVVTNLTGPDPFVPPPPPTPAAPPAAAAQWSPGPSANPSPAPPPAPAGGMADAFVNLGSGPYAAGSQLTSGGAQPWYDSPLVTQLFGGVPNAQQRSDFTNTVIQRVEQTYQQSGIPITVTADPNAPAAHTISVVSNTGYAANGNAVGITNEGGDGFSFIDKFGSAQNVDQLEWVVAHNVAHELMHAFGGEHHDPTGNFLDSAITSWQTMLDPNTRFSAAEVQDLSSKNFLVNTVRSSEPDGQMIAGASSVPEPGTLACWTLVGSVLAFAGRKRLPRRGA